MAVDYSSNMSFATKEFYDGQKVQEVTYTKRPLFASLRKKEDWEGSNYRLPTLYADIQSRSATFGTAYANKGNFSGANFALTTNADYLLCDISNETILATKSNKGAFMTGITTTVDSALRSISNTIEIDCFRDGSGARAQVGSVSTTSLTLLDIEDVVNFEVGMVLQADDTSDGSSPRTGTAAITAINRDTGVLTSGSNWTAQITGLAANDYLFQSGDAITGTSFSKIKGLAAWVPTTAPTSTTFFGVNRSVDTSRLGGIRYDGTALPIEEALSGGAYKIYRDGVGAPDMVFMGPQKFRDLINALGSKVMYVEHKVGEIGFSGIKLHATIGSMTVLPAWAQKNSRAHMLSMDTWSFVSRGMAPQIIEQEGPNGNVWHYNLSSDSYQLSVGYYGQVGCNAPGWNGVVSL